MVWDIIITFYIFVVDGILPRFNIAIVTNELQIPLRLFRLVFVYERYGSYLAVTEGHSANPQ